MKKLRFLGIIITLLFLSSCGNIQLPETGQTTSYDVNIPQRDDGALQVGVSWPDPRFNDNEDGTITDNLTGLMWLKDANCINTQYPDFDNDARVGDGQVTWQHGLDFVAGVNGGTGTYSNCSAGHTDWRLPNTNELESLVNAEEANTATWLVDQGFTSVRASYYWSATTYANAKDRAWGVEMWDGSVRDRTKRFSRHYVWPVRAGQMDGNSDSNYPANIWETGQTICYDPAGNIIVCADTGQDGEIQAGVSWSDPRFTDNGDGTVMDNLTELMWTQDGNAPAGSTGCTTGMTMAWQGALNYVECLNTNSYLDYNDWRLPNRKELHSLTDFSRSDPTLQSDPVHPFTNVQVVSPYWSATTYANDNDGAWYVDMSEGIVYPSNKTFSNYYVWPVRAGE